MLLNRERANTLMEREGLDALVATTPENVMYLSDYGTQHSFHFGPWGIGAAILPLDPDIPPTLLIQEWELPHVSERPSWMPGLEVQTGVGTYVPDETGLADYERRLVDLWRRGDETGLPNRQRLLARTLKELGLAEASLAFDDPRVMVELADEELAQAQVREAVNLFREVRMIKTPDEIEMLKLACSKNQAALESAAAMVGEGATTGQLLNHYLAAMSAQGGYGSHMTGGGVDRTWHTYPNPTYRLKRGDIYNMDPAGHFGYYWADLGRSAEVGGPSSKFEHLYGTLQACRAAIDPMLTQGVSTQTIKEESLRFCSEAMPHGLVPLLHSIGLEQYDHPQNLGEFLSEDFVFEEGMVINYEIPYLEFPWGMLQLEDTFVIGADAPTRLSTLPLDAFYPAAAA